MHVHCFGWLVGFLALSTIACGDPQADTEYAGDPLATVKGWIQVQQPVEVTQPRVSLVWFVTAGQDYFSLEGAPVEGEFPARFKIDLVKPPPLEALNDFTSDGVFPSESQVGIALIFVYDDGNANGRMDVPENEEAESPDQMLGVGLEHAVVYLAEDLKPDTLSAEVAGGPLSSGFHLMTIETADDQAYETCYNACSDAHCIDDGINEPQCDHAAIEQCQEGCGSGRDQLHETPDGFDTEISILLGIDPNDPDMEFPDFTK